MKVFAFCRNLLFAGILALVTSPIPTYSKVLPPKGFVGKTEKSVLALYGSSVSRGVQDAFICTAEVVQKVKDGYILLSAGHCTAANPELPGDITFDVSNDLGTPLMPVQLIKSEMNEPLDYAVFYLPTKEKLPVMQVGDSDKIRVEDKVLDVNFSLGVAKQVSEGFISSQGLTSNGAISDGSADGDFAVTMFGAGGASGSAVIDRSGSQNKKLVGIIIYGFDGGTMPMLAEPINPIVKKINGLIFVPETASQILAQRAKDAAAENDAAPYARANITHSCFNALQEALKMVGSPISAVIAKYGPPTSIAYGAYGENETTYYYNFLPTRQEAKDIQMEFIVSGTAPNLNAPVVEVILDSCN